MEGSDLKKLRNAMGLTQPEMATLFGVKKLQISRMENGHRKIMGSILMLAERISQENPQK